MFASAVWEKALSLLDDLLLFWSSFLWFWKRFCQSLLGLLEIFLGFFCFLLCLFSFFFLLFLFGFLGIVRILLLGSSLNGFNFLCKIVLLFNLQSMLHGSPNLLWLRILAFNFFSDFLEICLGFLKSLQGWLISSFIFVIFFVLAADRLDEWSANAFVFTIANLDCTYSQQKLDYYDGFHVFLIRL